MMLDADNKVPMAHICDVIRRRKEKVFTVFDCTTVVAWQLPNGFTLVESSGCIDPANYSESFGADICRKRLEAQVWKLEGYVGACEFSGGGSGDSA